MKIKTEPSTGIEYAPANVRLYEPDIRNVETILVFLASCGDYYKRLTVSESIRYALHVAARRIESGKDRSVSDGEEG